MSVVEYNPKTWVNEADNGTISDGAPALNAENLNYIETGIKQCTDAINELKALFDNESNRIINNLLTGTVIWENENPNEDFVAQTITPTNSGGHVDLAHYKRFVITVKYRKDQFNYYENTVSCKGVNYSLFTPLVNEVKTRGVTINEHDISFGDNWLGKNYNDYVIPIKIVAYTW